MTAGIDAVGDDASFALLANGLAFPEGPLFDVIGRLWVVELKGGRITQIMPDGGLSRYDVGGAPNGLALGPADEIWYCDATRNEIRSFNPDTGRTRSIVGSVAGVDLAAPNDLAFDAVGNLLFTCPNNARERAVGYVCCLTPEGDCIKVAEGLLYPNGLAFGADGTTFCLAETYARRVLRARWNALTSTLSGVTVLADTPGPTGPDGLAFAADGSLYACIYGTGSVMRVDVAGAVSYLTVPGANPTNCAFDPSGRLGLVVTEALTGAVYYQAEASDGAALFHPADAARGTT